MGKDTLHRVGNGGHCGCETVSREVLPQVEIPEKWTQEPPCFAITICCAIKIAHQWDQLRRCRTLLSIPCRKAVFFYIYLYCRKWYMGTIITLRPDKMAADIQITFPNSFFNVWSNWRQVSIGSGNGLAPDMWQVITCTNVDQDVIRLQLCQIQIRYRQTHLYQEGNRLS